MTDVCVFPGRLFGSGAPLPMYAGDVAARRGATVHRHTWTTVPAEEQGPGLVGWVRGEVTPVLDRVGGSPLVIGKSLGSLCAAVAAERGLPAVWLTPLLTLPWAQDAYAGATAPVLLVGGTADEAWDGALARRLTPHVLEVPDADHGMYVPGPLTASVAVLGQVVAAVEGFLAAIGWGD